MIKKYVKSQNIFNVETKKNFAGVIEITDNRI